MKEDELEEDAVKKHRSNFEGIVRTAQAKRIKDADVKLMQKQNVYDRLYMRIDNVPFKYSVLYETLHNDILSFKAKVKRDLSETQAMKESVIEKIKGLVNEHLPGCEIKLYGSFATDLSLCWSDIDLVIDSGNGGMQQSYEPLHWLSLELEKEKWVSKV